MGIGWGTPWETMYLHSFLCIISTIQYMYVEVCPFSEKIKFPFSNLCACAAPT